MLFALHDYDENLKKRGAFCIPVKDALDFNKQGYGIFTTVNSFKTNRRIETNIEKFCYWFIDLDEGSKSTQFNSVVDFKLIPSLVVETKRGHHVYWRVKAQPTKKEYDSVLERLIKHFGSDTGAKSCTRILRTPGFLHQKNPDRPFTIKQLYASDRVYGYSDFDNVLPEIETKPAIQKQSHTQSCDEFWNNANNIPTDIGILKLSGVDEVNGQEFEIMSEKNGKRQIKVNGKQANCFIDTSGAIGSTIGAGPTVVNWIKFYGHSDARAAEIIKKYFPETIPALNFKIEG